MAKHNADLVAYYDSEIRARAARDLPAERLERRAAFVELMRSERRETLLEIGAGAGRDGVAFLRAGLTYTGVDLAPQSGALCRTLGLKAHVASVLDLPFEERAFDAVWTMSTLLHVPSAQPPSALAEIGRVARPGSPVAIGLWGAPTDHEELWDDGTGFGPPRFFSLRSDASLLEVLLTHGSIEEWHTWPGTKHHYQWVVLRTPSHSNQGRARSRGAPEGTNGE